MSLPAFRYTMYDVRRRTTSLTSSDPVKKVNTQIFFQHTTCETESELEFNPPELLHAFTHCTCIKLKLGTLITTRNTNLSIKHEVHTCSRYGTTFANRYNMGICSNCSTPNNWTHHVSIHGGYATSASEQ